METLLDKGGLKIVAKQDNLSSLFGVFLDNKEVDWFPTYAMASRLAQDLFASAKVTSPGDDMIGARKWCPSAMGNGQIVVVVAKSRNGYIVQPTGTSRRMEVAANVLTEPLAYPFAR